MKGKGGRGGERRRQDTPGCLDVEMVDVLGDRVVNKHGRELLLEVWPQGLQ